MCPRSRCHSRRPPESQTIHVFAQLTPWFCSARSTCTHRWIRLNFCKYSVYVSYIVVVKIACWFMHPQNYQRYWLLHCKYNLLTAWPDGISPLVCIWADHHTLYLGSATSLIRSYLYSLGELHRDQDDSNFIPQVLQQTCCRCPRFSALATMHIEGCTTASIKPIIHEISSTEPPTAKDFVLN
jgi:hypothetical protein